MTSVVDVERPGVTVVIPVWGRAYLEALPGAVGSIRASALTARTIVVDNAGEPPLEELDGCWVVRSETRLSTGAARNLGLSSVETELVMFLDADDRLLPGALDILADGMDVQSELDVLVGRILTPNGRVFRLPRSFCRFLSRAPRLLGIVNATWPVMSIQGCALMRAAAVRTAGQYPDASLSEDWVLSAALALRVPVGFTRAPILVYRRRPDSPGMRGTTVRKLMHGARLVRERLRAKADPPLSRLSLSCLAAAQFLVICGLRPVARAARAVGRA